MAEKKITNTKDVTKHICNPVSQGTLYFSFALSLWTSVKINDPQVKGIAVFLTLISLFYFVAVFSEWVLKLTQKMLRVLLL